MAKIIWSCGRCGTVLALWQMKCTNCHRAALSWLHLVVCVGLAVPAVIFFIKLI